MAFLLESSAVYGNSSGRSFWQDLEGVLVWSQGTSSAVDLQGREFWGTEPPLCGLARGKAFFPSGLHPHLACTSLSSTTHWCVLFPKSSHAREPRDCFLALEGRRRDIFLHFWNFLPCCRHRFNFPFSNSVYVECYHLYLLMSLINQVSIMALRFICDVESSPSSFISLAL